MKTYYKVDWTDESIKNLDSIIEYLTIRWTDREIRNFYKLLEKTIELISRNPLIFPASELKKNVRRTLLSKQTTIYYEIKKNRIIILSLFDNRKNPKSIKL